MGHPTVSTSLKHLKLREGRVDWASAYEIGYIPLASTSRTCTELNLNPGLAFHLQAPSSAHGCLSDGITYPYMTAFDLQVAIPIPQAVRSYADARAVLAEPLCRHFRSLHLIDGEMPWGASSKLHGRLTLRTQFNCTARGGSSFGNYRAGRHKAQACSLTASGMAAVVAEEPLCEDDRIPT